MIEQVQTQLPPEPISVPTDGPRIPKSPIPTTGYSAPSVREKLSEVVVGNQQLVPLSIASQFLH